MTPRQSTINCGKPEPLGLASSRCSGRRMSPLTLQPYKVVVQAVLLYSSETWVLSMTALASLEGFHIRAGWRMAVRHKPWRGPGHGWIYPKSKDVLEECRMSTLAEYILVCRQTIAVYMATRPILTNCRQGKHKREAVPHRWWWEQQMDLDIHDPLGSNE